MKRKKSLMKKKRKPLNVEIVESLTNQQKKEKSALVTLKESDKMSAKFAQVGRDIVIALMAGSWLLLRFYNNDSSTLYLIKYSLVFSFIYLLIDLVYYCTITIVYWAGVKFDKKGYTIYKKDENKLFIWQTNLKFGFMVLSVIKTIILFISIILICIFVFKN